MSAGNIAQEWEDRGSEYRAVITEGTSSSSWLRDVVLKPEILRLLGNRSQDRILDAGTGSGWLFDATKVGEAHACDIATPGDLAANVTFVEADIAHLPYQDDFFDAVVSSIVLCYCEDLTAAVSELQRVTRPGGTMVAALVHPIFYRTGEALDDDRFLVEADLSRTDRTSIHIGATVGPFTYYRRSVSDYLNVFIHAGWQLDEIRDLFAPRNDYEARFRKTDLVRRSTRVPLFVAFRLKKAR